MNPLFWSASLALFFLLVLSPPASAHGGQMPKAPADQQGVSPAMRGSEDFMMALAGAGNGVMAEEQMARVDVMMRHLGFAKAIRDGQAPDSAEADAEYNRWMAEQALLDYVKSTPDMITFDLIAPQGNEPPSVTLKDASSTALVKVTMGEGEIRWITQVIDLKGEYYGEPFTIEIAPAGTTYVLMIFPELPSTECINHIRFQPEGSTAPPHFRAFTVIPPAMGNLGVSVLDENGQETPVLLRLTAKGGKLWEPANAVDFRPMLNDVTRVPGYGPGRAYMFFTPGEYQGHYWVTPAPFEMALPAGEWEVRILHGPEYAPVHETFTVPPGQWTRRIWRLRRWTDMRALGWYSGDDHVHSRLMDSEDANRLMAYTKAADIHVSNILEMGDSMRTYYSQRGFGPGFRVESDGHWLVPGQEDPRSVLGHNIALNITSLVRDVDSYLLLDLIAEGVHRQGGLFGQTHVGANACEAHRGMALMTPRGLYDFYSVMQAGLGTELYYDFLDLGYKLTASAGSDTPYGGTLGGVRIYACAGTAAPFTPDAWFDAVRQGHTFATNGPMVSLDVDGSMPGDTLEVDVNRPLRVRARAWGLEGESAPKRLELVRLGQTAQAADSTEPNQTELTLDVTLDSGYGYWIAARVLGVNGSEAHTTPVYVSRKGFRHWNPDRVEEAVAKRQAHLAEIEDSIGKASKARADGTLLAWDYWTSRQADQAEALRDRINLARKAYEDLLVKLNEEKMARAQP